MEASMDFNETRSGGRAKFIVGGALIFAAIVYLIATATMGNQQYFRTVDELVNDSAAMVGQSARVSGAVMGDTITWDADSLTLSFSMANMPGEQSEIDAQGGLAAVLHEATTDPNRSQITVVYVGPKPDLLRNEAQAIVTGKLGEDGIFYADELLLKCPTRYEDAVPSQVDG